MASKTDTRPQFTLAALFGAVIACGVIFGCLANVRTIYFVSIRCHSLPANDQKLHAWFEDQAGVVDTWTSRDENTVNVGFTKPHGSFELVMPPLAELGYTGLQEMKSTISNTSVIGGALNWVSTVPVVVWFAVAAIFTAVLVWKINRRRVSPMAHVQSEAK